MPPDTNTQPGPSRDRVVERKREPQAGQVGVSGTSSTAGSGSGQKDRVGNYQLGGEIGRGSFATVYKGFKSVSTDSNRLV